MNARLSILSAVAVAAAIAAALPMTASAGPADTPTYTPEKCYGVALAGKNDCETNTHSCAGTATADGQANSWVYVPTGLCGKIVNGTLSPKA